MDSKLLFSHASRQDVEALRDDRVPEMRRYGALPHYRRRSQFSGQISEVLRYFSAHHDFMVDTETGRHLYMDGLFAYMLKFGESPAVLAERVLAHYPLRDGVGDETLLFGLSGSGKSSVCAHVRAAAKDGVVVMDSDTMRFNLFAPTLLAVEVAHGNDLADLTETRTYLLYNDAISPMFNLLRNHISKELRGRGYRVLMNMTMPRFAADRTFYLEHPDGIDPESMIDDEIPYFSRRLAEHTDARVGAQDDYPWETARVVTRLEDMVPVSTRVPVAIHAHIIREIRKAFLDPSRWILTVPNHRSDDGARKTAELLMRAMKI